MSVTPELDAQFRAVAVREGLVDVRYDVIDSPVGELLVASTERGLARIHFGHDGQEESSRASSACVSCARRSTRFAASWTSTSRASAASFDLPLDLRVAAFNGEVLRELARVPYGHHDDLRQPRGEGRPAEGSARGRDGDEPQPDPDRAAVPPRRRCERIADGLRRRARPQAAAPAARRSDAAGLSVPAQRRWTATIVR